MRQRGRHGDKVTAVGRRKRIVGQCYRLSKWGDVVIDAYVLHVYLGVGAHTKQVIASKGDPVEERPAYPLERKRGLVDPATDLFCITRTEPDLIASVKATLVSVRGGLAIYTGTQFKFLQRHRYTLRSKCGTSLNDFQKPPHEFFGFRLCQYSPTGVSAGMS